MDVCGESVDDYLSGGGDDDVVREVQMQALSTSSVFGGAILCSRRWRRLAPSKKPSYNSLANGLACNCCAPR